MTTPPNLLFLWTDQHRADALGCYGNAQVRTPNFDRLAERSCVFENAYCTQPVCTPSRASILTGLWPHTHGCVTNNIPLPKQTPTIAELAGGDYACGNFGKWHLGDEIVAQRGFDHWVSIEDVEYRPYYSKPEYFERRTDYHWFLIENGFEPDHEFQDGAMLVSRPFAAVMSEQYTKAAFLGRRSAEFIREQAGRPWLLSVNFLEPHTPNFGPFNDLHDPAALPVGPAFGVLPPGNGSKRNRVIAAHYSHDREKVTEAY